MPPPPADRPATQLDVRAPMLQVKRWFARAPKRDIRTRACHVVLPRMLWDRIILLTFTCCLLTFLHALFGFGAVDEDPRTPNEPFGIPNAALSISSSWNRGSGGSRGDMEIRTRGVAWAMVDWHGNYELFPNTGSALVSPASIPQDGFPDPTPVLAGVGRGRALDENPPPITTRVKVPVEVPFAFDETPYDPFRLELGDSVDGGEVRRLYLITGPPRTAPRGVVKERFGGCFLGGACL